MSENKKLAMTIQAENADLKGRYANKFLITAQEREIVIDFLSQVRIGDQEQNLHVARIFLHHHVADELFKLLERLRKNWEEKRYGTGIDQVAKDDEKTGKEK